MSGWMGGWVIGRQDSSMRFLRYRFRAHRLIEAMGRPGPSGTLDELAENKLPLSR